MVSATLPTLAAPPSLSPTSVASIGVTAGEETKLEQNFGSQRNMGSKEKPTNEPRPIKTTTSIEATDEREDDPASEEPLGLVQAPSVSYSTQSNRSQKRCSEVTGATDAATDSSSSAGTSNNTRRRSSLGRTPSGRRISFCEEIDSQFKTECSNFIPETIEASSVRKIDRRGIAKAMQRENASEGEIRMAQQGLLSTKSMIRLNNAEDYSYLLDESFSSDYEEEGKVSSANKEEEDEIGVQAREVVQANSRLAEDRVEAAAQNMKKQSRIAGELRMAKKGLMSKKSIKRLSLELCGSDSEDEEISGRVEKKDANNEYDSFRTSSDGAHIVPVSRRKPSHQWIDGRPNLSRDFVGRAMQQMSAPEGEIRMAQQGLLSKQSMIRLGNDIDYSYLLNEDFDSDDGTGEEKEDAEPIKQLDVKKCFVHRKTLSRDDQVEAALQKMGKQNRIEGEIRMAKQGLMSQKSVRRLSYELLDTDCDDEPTDEDEVNSLAVIEKEDNENELVSNDTKEEVVDSSTTAAVEDDHYPESEIRSVRLGIVCRKTAADRHKRRKKKRDLTKQVQIDMEDKAIIDANIINADVNVVNVDNYNEDETIDYSYLSNKTPACDEVTLAESTDGNNFLFSRKELEHDLNFDEHCDGKGDVLMEGQYYLGISMLVYMYSHLRETCRMGHTKVTLEDIDVNSVQSQYNQANQRKKYLSKTKTAGSIIRVVIDELEREDENDEEHELLAGEAQEYEKSIMSEFRKWIQDSRVSQLDEETEKMIAELKRKVARHRWKRAISAVRLSYKLSGGKRPKFEAPVSAPGCENENRFVDMNQMMSEAIKNQPRYFRQGSVMNNLVESGIEVAWFSDLSQNDVVYGICCHREQKKVIVVFRGTVNSHNWKMNLKFHTNQYRNPVRVEYPGRKEELSLHSGFALYMMRRRNDTGMSKMQEIFKKIDEIGREMAPDGGYQLSITGHSLGGALATLLAFYVAAKPRFSHLKRVYVWTFASPRVGTNAFRDAYQYLEQIGRIRHARFSATHDIVPLVPFSNFQYNDLQFYKHVGVRVQLHGVGKIGKWRLRRALDVTYAKDLDWLSELRRVFMNNIFANLNTVAGFKRNHTLTEHQKRIHFSSQYRNALGSGVFFADQKRNRIKSLDEYYCIRANITNRRGSLRGGKSDVSTVQNPSRACKKPMILVLLVVLIFLWMCLAVSVVAYNILNKPSSEVILSLLSSAASIVWRAMLLPLSAIQVMCNMAALPVHFTAKLFISRAMASIGALEFQGRGQNRYIRWEESAFVRKSTPSTFARSKSRNLHLPRDMARRKVFISSMEYHHNFQTNERIKSRTLALGIAEERLLALAAEIGDSDLNFRAF